MPTQTIPTPDWLTRRDGSLRASSSSNVYFVFLSGTPQYKLVVTPVGSTFGCAVTQTINGRRLDTGKASASADEAIRTGLKDLQTALGWE